MIKTKHSSRNARSRSSSSSMKLMKAAFTHLMNGIIDARAGFVSQRKLRKSVAKKVKGIGDQTIMSMIQRLVQYGLVTRSRKIITLVGEVARNQFDHYWSEIFGDQAATIPAS